MKITQNLLTALIKICDKALSNLADQRISEVNNYKKYIANILDDAEKHSVSPNRCKDYSEVLSRIGDTCNREEIVRRARIIFLNHPLDREEDSSLLIEMITSGIALNGNRDDRDLFQDTLRFICDLNREINNHEFHMKRKEEKLNSFVQSDLSKTQVKLS